ncbi:hypothetical protein DL96DRAFT_62472 [Flagelloscypha sp. PMI_526]|nr:hypothetical protein DL96DRAFT_62472 [Flagelloscypha sp. PMI_526]
MVLYKLSRRVGQEGEETRRLSIPGPPLAWYELSQQLSSLFNIPVNQVAVRYKDEEGDMITLSSETELEDYYASLQIQSSDTVKFVVFNLSSSRVPSMAADSTRAPSRASDFDPTEANRDTFGAAPDHPLAFDLDGPWERILAPGADLHMPFGLAKTDSDRFEELSTTTMSSVVKPVDLDALSNHSDSSGTTVPPPSQNKGKARASSFVGLEATNNQYGLWSTNSLLASQAPPKQTVHILNVADDDEPDFGLHNSSTPKVNVGNLRPVESLGSLPEAEPLLPTQEVPDPPEADIHSHNAVPPAPAPSFANDLSQFLNSFSAAVASHPELSEGLRNLVQNTTSGAYWAAHQAAMSDMASRLSSRTADEMQRAEQDAYRRTTEILGTLFRTLAAGVTNNPEASQNEGENADPPPAETGTAREPVDGPPVPPPPPGNWGHWFPGRHSMPPWRAFHPGPPDSMFGPPPFPPHPPMGGHPWPHPPPRSRGGPPPPVPPPPGDRTRPTPAELRAQVEAAKLLYKAEKERYRAEREQRRQEKERRVQIDQAIGKGVISLLFALIQNHSFTF